MDDKTLTALRASIKHWEENVAVTKQGERSDLKLGLRDCALCGLFRDQDCEGCPVAEKTGQPICRGTPYYAVTCSPFGTLPQAVQAELDFLKSLLPEKGTN